MALEHTIVQAEGASPHRGMLFLHGMLGRGANWQSFARRFVARRPDWAAVLVDLRMHGGSRGLAPPHTLAAAAADLGALAQDLQVPVRGVLGHSFGGKVALSWVREAADRLDEVWLVDSPPGARGEDEGAGVIRNVIATLRELPPRWPRRNAFVGALEQAGIVHETALWLAQNLEREDGELIMRLDLDAMDELLSDHYHTDLWPIVDDLPDSLRLHIVVGGRSLVFTPRERARAEAYARRGKIELHMLEHAGHWVQTDDPEGLLACMTSEATER